MTIHRIESEEVSALARALKEDRTGGQVTVALARHDTHELSKGLAIKVVKEFIVPLLGTPPHHLDCLRLLNVHEAKKSCPTWLATDLAYDERLMTDERALSHVKAFLAQFDQPYCFVNWNNGGWSSLTNSTFDAGLIAIDSTRIGVLCVEDED